VKDFGSPPSDVCVVITTYNHAHFLDDALRSVAEQTRPAAQVIVVDDGSTDHPAAVVARWPFAQLIRQDNQGPSAARNTGLRANRATFVIFLDADDLLDATALEAGLTCAAANEDAALVYGAHRRIEADGRPVDDQPIYQPPGQDAVSTLLRGNAIGMQATVVYRSSVLLEAGCFDEGLRRCEDYDVYLRLAHGHRVASHSQVVAYYRRHELNASRDHVLMLRGALQVQRRYRPGRNGTPDRRSAYRQGRKSWRDYYAAVAYLEARAEGRSHVSSLSVALRCRPSPALLRHVAAATARRFAQSLRRRRRT
jgi:glycosyltransferase involved in cell wall biosynthesis